MSMRSCCIVLTLAGTAIFPACAVEAPLDPDAGAEPTPTAPQNYALSWIGEYVGSGVGTVRGTGVTFPEARLVVTLDADSLRSERCPGCVTVTLDTLFTVVNLAPRDPIRLTLTVSHAGYRRTLHLDRFSGGGRTANVLSGRLLLDALDGSGPVGDVTYLLELRS